MSVVLSVEESGPCRRDVKIEVPAAAVEAELDRVSQQYRKRVRLPGFRKGKAPAHLIRQRFGEEIEQEVLDRLVPRYWRQAESEAQLDPMLPPHVSEVDFEAGQPLVFTAVVETRPEIDVSDLDGFRLPEADVTVAPAEVDEALEDLRRQAADWVAVERAAAVGDRVEGDMAETTGEATGEPQRVAFEVGDPQVWEELSLAVTGAPVGRQVSFDRSEGEGDDASQRSFELTVTAVEERELPELDDALAQKIGSFENLQAMREDVERHIAAGKARELRQERERALIEQMRERWPSELPEGVVRRETESLMREYARTLQMRGVDVEKADIDWQGLSGELEPQAERRVHARLLLDAAAAKLELAAGEEELERALAALGQAQGASSQSVRQALARDGRLEELREQLTRDKVVRRLLGEPDPAVALEPDTEPEPAGLEEE